MANKQLTAQVRLNTTQAEQKLKRIAKAIDALNNAVGKQTNAYAQVNKALGKTVTLKAKVKQKTDENTKSTKKWSNALDEVNKKLNGSSRSVGMIGGKLKRLASTYLGVMGTSAAVRTSDMITSAENKLNYINNGDTDLTKDTMNKMYASSQKVRMGYGDMMSNVSKSMALAGDAFDNNTDKAIRFQEIMAEAYAVGGASAQEMSSSMYQLIQALGAGTLAGDELRSVREGAPLAYKEIEKFAQKVYDSEDSLKDMASQGLITADIVTAAIMESGDAMDKAFAQTEQTFAQTWEQIKNAAIYAFKPISEMLREALNDAIDSGLLQKVETAFSNIAKAIMITFQIIFNVISWIADNWDWLQHIVIGAIMVMITYYLIKMGVAIYCAYQEIKAWIAANATMLTTLAVIAIIIIGIMALIYVFYLWKTGAIDTCQAIVTALLIVGVVVAIIGLLIGSWVVAIIGLVIAAIGLIINWLEYFLGAVYSIGAFIYNFIVGVVNAILQFFWAAFVEPFIGIIEFILNCCMGGFDSFGGAVANLIGQIIGWFLSLGQVVTKIIDAIFGTNWTAGLESLKSKVTSWGKNENSITINREAPTVESLTGGLLPDRIAYTDAWNKGKEHGTIAKDWMNNLGSKFQNQGEKGNFLDNLGNKLGLDFSDLTGGFPTEGVGDVASDFDPSKALGNIDDNTGKMADSMDLTSEDVEYLRKIAGMEWKKETTIADIKVDMSNYNTINSDRDLDGIVTKLTEKLYEELNEVADGVYAY